MSDTPETDALLRQQDRDSTPYDLSADQLVKLFRKLERERAEWRECAEGLAWHLRQRIGVILNALAEFERLKDATQ